MGSPRLRFKSLDLNPCSTTDQPIVDPIMNDQPKIAAAHPALVPFHEPGELVIRNVNWAGMRALSANSADSTDMLPAGRSQFTSR